MRKMLKKLMTMVLAGIFLVTAAGCGSSQAENDLSEGGSQSTAKGRYMETQIETLTGISHADQMLQLADGTLVILDGSNGVAAKSTDQGANWTTEGIESVQKLLNGANKELCGMTMNKDGELYYSYIDWDNAQEGENKYPSNFVKVDAQGNESVLDMTGVDLHGSMSKLLAADNGKFYMITNGGEVYEVDFEAKTATRLFDTIDPNFMNINICDSQLIAVTNEKAYIYDMETGKMDADDSILNEEVAAQLSDYEQTMVFTAGQEEKTIYLADASGVYRHVIDGSVMEQLVNGELATMGNPSKKLVDIRQVTEQEFLIAYRDGTLCSYQYDADAYVVPQQQLNVYSLTDNETVRQAISIMQKNNPNVFVKLEVGMTGDDSMTASDAIKNLNVKMMAKEGPDVLILDGMPVDSYIEKGLLMDMTDLMKTIESSGNYFNNLLHTYDKDGVYAVPFRCLIPVMTGEKKSLSTIADLTSLIAQAQTISDAGTTKTALDTYTPQQTLKKLYMTSSADWLDEKGSVDAAKLKEFLKAAKQMYEADQKNLSESDINKHKERPIYEEDAKVKVNEIKSSLMQENDQTMDHLFKNTQMTYGILGSMRDFQMVYSLQQAEPDQGYELAVGQTSESFVPNGIVGICTGTTQQELAEQFVTTLLSKEVQQTDLSDGFPVNEDAFDTWSVKPADAEYSMGVDDEDGNSAYLDVLWPSEEAFAELKAKIKEIKTVCLMDTTIQETVLNYGAAALTGKKTVDDCTNEIMQKISIYNEE